MVQISSSNLNWSGNLINNSIKLKFIDLERDHKYDLIWVLYFVKNLKKKFKPLTALTKNNRFTRCGKMGRPGLPRVPRLPELRPWVAFLEGSEKRLQIMAPQPTSHHPRSNGSSA